VLLKEKITICASPAAVWEYIGSPELWSLFHCKSAGDSTLVSAQADTVGARYEMMFRLGSHTSLAVCEIVERQTEHLIAVDSTKFEEGDRKKTMTARITYTLSGHGDKTKVVEKIEFDSKLIPIYIRPVVWLISRIGKPVGQTTLQGLRRVVET